MTTIFTFTPDKGARSMDAVQEIGQPTGSLTTLAHVARLVTEISPSSLCCPCIANTLARRLSSVRQAAARLEGSDTYVRRHDRCGGCQQTRLVLGIANAPATTSV
jgi:hypothetical protein